LDEPSYTAALREACLPPDVSALDRLNRIRGEIPSVACLGRGIMVSENCNGKVSTAVSDTDIGRFLTATQESLIAVRDEEGTPISVC
jgi:hypothetical protein